MKTPVKPTPEFLEARIRAFDEDPETAPAERALTDLFHRYPLNDAIEPILLKVAALNAFYATNVYAVLKVSRHIFDLRIDPYIAKGDLEIVNRIADFTIKGKRRRIFSFATKYCSWHFPERYPMFDSYVAQLLHAYSRLDHFSRVTWNDMRTYQRFVELVEEFRSHYRLLDFSFKQIDKFLWHYGLELYGGD